MNPFVNDLHDLAVKALSVVLQHRMKRQLNFVFKVLEPELIKRREDLIQRRIKWHQHDGRRMQEIRDSLEHHYLNDIGFIDEELRSHLQQNLENISIVESLPEHIDPAEMASLTPYNLRFLLFAVIDIFSYSSPSILSCFTMNKRF